MSLLRWGCEQGPEGQQGCLGTQRPVKAEWRRCLWAEEVTVERTELVLLKPSENYRHDVAQPGWEAEQPWGCVCYRDVKTKQDRGWKKYADPCLFSFLICLQGLPFTKPNSKPDSRLGARDPVSKGQPSRVQSKQKNVENKSGGGKQNKTE